MRAVVQRVLRARVVVVQEGQGGPAGTGAGPAPAEEVAGEIGPGVVVLVGVQRGDGPEAARYIAEKVAHLRIFEDEQGKMNRSLLDVGGAALVVSQFTLYGDVRRGRRPGFDRAARPEEAGPLYDQVCAELRSLGVPVATGRFQTHMRVELVNDGPVTILIDSDREF